MRILTLWQPWATLIAIGAKTVETRSWATPYRGKLAIHAAAKKPRPEWYTPEITDALVSADIEPLGEPRRAVVALCELSACVPVAEALTGRENDAYFGDFSDGRFGWLLDDALDLTVAGVELVVKGQLGVWTPTWALEQSINELRDHALAEAA